MHQRVRCPHCHHWTDALLVWAAGDCCPSCNEPLSEPRPEPAEQAVERPWRTGRIASPARGRDRIVERP